MGAVEEFLDDSVRHFDVSDEVGGRFGGVHALCGVCGLRILPMGDGGELVCGCVDETFWVSRMQ